MAISFYSRLSLFIWFLISASNRCCNCICLAIVCVCVYNSTCCVFFLFFCFHLFSSFHFVCDIMRAHFFLDYCNNDYSRMSASRNTLHFYWESICKEFDGKLVIIVWNKNLCVLFTRIKSRSVHKDKATTITTTTIRYSIELRRNNITKIEFIMFQVVFRHSFVSTFCHTVPKYRKKNFVKCSDLFYFTLSFHLISLLRLFRLTFTFTIDTFFKPSIKLFRLNSMRVRSSCDCIIFDHMVRFLL